MSETDPIRRALVIKLRHHGDVLLTSPLFRALRHHRPGIEIDALVYEETTPMLEGHPDITRIHTIRRSAEGGGLRGELELVGQLRARRYDLLIHLTESWRGALLSRLLKPRIAVTARWPRRRGSRFWSGSFTHHYPQPARLRHVVEKHLDALRCIGIHPAPHERGLLLVPGQAAEDSVNRLLDREGLRGQPFIHFHPTSRWLFKCWRTDHCSRFIALLQQRGYRVVVTAAPDRAELERVRAILDPLSEPVVDLSGELSLKELAALIGHARCFVGMDSVPMHMAAAMGTPTVALFGPSGDQEWGPWMVPHRVITTPLSCRPCGLDGCAGSKISDCLDRIQPEAVLAAVEELIGS
ncbi:MAG: putative lipopolysaccharide heptosyltransferase III [Gammaproteobacteria bacterium]|nr:MAG: putative lipopolysaccharide heptosyltransferase III [Gammaproteobacteria bacterium]